MALSLLIGWPGKASLGREQLSKDLMEVREGAWGISEGRALQAERAASTKALRHVCTCLDGITMGMLV